MINLIIKKKVLCTFLFLLIATLDRVFAQSVPNGLLGVVKDEAPEPEFYDLGQYNKTKTQFDGVTHDQKVNYLKMARTTGVKIPVMSTGTGGTGNTTDFTVMMWFKFELLEPDQDLMYLFSFTDSAACFITKTLSIMCDNSDRKKLQVTSDLLQPGLWFHLTLSISQSKVSYLLLQNNSQGQLAIDKDMSQFSFIQDTQYAWQACLGDCLADLGLIGGMREVVLRNSYIKPDDALQAKNMQFTYSPDFKAYFRFQDVEDRFARDEFIDRSWVSIKPANLTSQDYIGLDLIPNDVCPTSYDQKKYFQFNGAKPFDGIQLNQTLRQNDYAYSFSSTFKVTNTTCFTSNPTAAASYCNIFMFEEVFMIYFETINMLKVHFFASKNYYESASKAFFIPYNQWVTVQLTLARYSGFDLVVADQNGNVFYSQTNSNQDMQTMNPRGKISFFNSFNGYVDHILLCPYQSVIKRPQIKIDKTTRDCFYNFQLSDASISDAAVAQLNSTTISKQPSIKNRGLSPDLVIPKSSTMTFTFYQGQNSDKNAGTFKAENQFDGIACDDGHMTLNLQTSDSYFRFNTPSQKMWQSESTIEFWFKLSDPKVYTSSDKVYLFSMRDMNGKYPYYEIYVQSNMLFCAPFGSQSMNDLYMSIEQFTLSNEDQFGWWHVSCSYSFQKMAKFSLFNTNVNANKSVSLVGSSSFYPQDSLLGSFGQPSQSNPSKGSANLFIKEVRYWASQLQPDQISLWRYRQINPLSPATTNKLLTYLRLASGSYEFMNFADINPLNQYSKTLVTTSGITYVQEYLKSITYYYDVVSAKVLSRADKTYHTVCPLFTYFQNKYCYAEPVNKLILTIFPLWNNMKNQIDWTFSVLNSSTIDTEILASLDTLWQSNDGVLDQKLNSSSEKQMINIDSSYLRHESQYQINVSLSNEQKTFNQSQMVKFVPSRCLWYIAQGTDASSYYKVLAVSPGSQELSFNLIKMKNKSLDCSKFNFFDVVDTIDFEYIIYDTTDFIQVDPETQFTIQSDGTINVTINSQEQLKLPVFRDISLLCTIRWKNSQLPSNEVNDYTFQHVLLTIKFEPTDNELVANLIASDTDIIQGDTLILDASSSYISNMPEKIKTRGLAFQWICPTEFRTFCNGQNGSQLQIPQALVNTIQKNNSTYKMFDNPFQFTAVISWNKPDSDIAVDKLTQMVKFWNIDAPVFDVVFSPSPVLITDVKNTVFSMVNSNFDLTKINNYNVEWIIDPKLNDFSQQTVLQNGQILQVNKGSFSANTAYTITATITNVALSKLTYTKQVKFTTKAAPSGGIVIVSPKSGYIGQEITVSLDGWSSDNAPIVFNVFTTLDDNGLRKGLMMNKGAPVSASDKFKFISKDSRPIQIEITDASNEIVNFIEVLDLSSDVFFAPQNDVNGARSSTPDVLLSQLKNSDVATEKVNLISVIIDKSLESNPTSPQSQQTFLLDTSSQILIRQSLLQALNDQIDTFGQKPLSQDMTAEDFIVKTMPLVRNMTSIVDFIDKETAQSVIGVVEKLKSMKTGLFNSLLISNVSLRNDYLGILQNLNTYARLKQSLPTSTYIQKSLSSFMDLMCSQSPEQTYTSPKSSEIEVQLYKFDKNTAMLNKKAVINVLDAEYNLLSYDLFNKFPITPGQICAQVSAINGLNPSAIQRRDLAESKITSYSQAVLQVSIFEIGTKKKYSLGELSGTTIVEFDLMPSTFRNNQTVCMAYSKNSQKWDANLCASQIIVEKVQIQCTCNSFQSNLTSIFTDLSRQQDPTVINFPTKAQSLSTIATSAIKESKKSGSHVWLSTSIMFSFVLLLAAGIAFRIDLNDNQKDMQSQIAEQHPQMSFGSQSSGMNHFVLEVARELHQPYAEVEFRKQSLFTYRSICTKSVLLHSLAQMHPLISPFMSHFATQSRLFRFSAYLLHLNSFTFFACAYFNATSYRISNIRVDDSVIDQYDIKQVAKVVAIGSVILLPFMSEPILSLFSDVIQRVVHSEAKYMDDIKVEVKKQRQCLRIAVIVLGLLSTIITPIWAVVEGKSTPSSNQYCIFTSILGAIIASMFFTNFIYIVYNSMMAKSMVRGKLGRFRISNWLVCHKALRIAQDLRAVQEASKLFTLSDVLPSSLENSERGEVAQQVNKQLLTLNAEIRTELDKNSSMSEGKSDQELSKDPNVEDSFCEAGHPNSQHQVRTRRARNGKAELPTTKAYEDQTSGGSLTYTEYKAKLGVDDRAFKSNASKARQNNYIRDEDSSQLDGESNLTSIACNEQELVQAEASSAEFININRSRNVMGDEVSQCISQNISFCCNRNDVSRNDILPIKGIGSNSSQAQSDFSDIRLDHHNSEYSSLTQEAKIHSEQTKKPSPSFNKKAK